MARKWYTFWEKTTILMFLELTVEVMFKAGGSLELQEPPVLRGIFFW
jgi:hypothetical protein